jgi:hypothetical protein
MGEDAMRTWEYCYIDTKGGYFGSVQRVVYLTTGGRRMEELEPGEEGYYKGYAQLGQQGWELVSREGYPFFKRPVCG